MYPLELAQKYEFVRVLGRGGMGEVHLAVQRTLGRKVAIKLLLARGVEDPTMRERFQREVLIMSTLNHPGIVTVFESETLADGAMFIVMEFVEGRTLEEIRTSEPPGDWRRVLAWTRELAGALEFAHQRGIVHRDIKPHNIMITPAGNVKVMDFGIAKSQGASHLTQDTIIGTPSYMSPEQARGGKIDARTDLYSLGCVMYAMIGGRPVFGADGESSLRVIQDQIATPPVLLSRYAPHVPAPVVQLVHDLLAKAPADRPASAGELLKRLDALEVELAKGFLQRTVDRFNVPSRLAKGELARFDFVLLEILLPGFGHFQRGSRVLGAVLALVSLALFFAPFAITLSVAIRALAAGWMYLVSFFEGRVAACIEFIRHNHIVAGPLVVVGVLVLLGGVFLAESEWRLASSRRPKPVVVAQDPNAHSRPPEILVRRPDPTPTPAPTPTPEPTERPAATPQPAATAAPATPTPRAIPATPTPRPSPTPVIVRATPTPAPQQTMSLSDALVIRPRTTPTPIPTAYPTPEPRATTPPLQAEWASDEELIALVPKLQRERAEATIYDALATLHTKATPTDAELVARAYLGYTLSTTAAGSYNRGRNTLNWGAWETDQRVMLERMTAGSAAATDAFFAVATVQPISTTLNFTKARNFSPFFAGPAYRDALATALRSGDEDRQVAALLLMRDVPAPELTPEIARLVAYTHGGPSTQEAVRSLALQWLKAHGTAAAIPALNDAMATNRLLPSEQTAVRQLVNDVLPKRP